jgi:Ca2+-binding RTX toxin-like protein
MPNNILGTPGDDIIVGTALADIIDGLAGNDVIAGGDGNDRLFGRPHGLSLMFAFWPRSSHFAMS